MRFIRNPFFACAFLAATALHAQAPELLKLDVVSEFGYHPAMGDSLSEPEGITVSVSGDVYIADTGNNRIVQFTKDGQYLTHRGGFGFAPREFDVPVDVSTVDGINIYVADFNNRRIQRLDKFLRFVSSLGASSMTAPDVAIDANTLIELDFPGGVAVTAQGDLFYTEPQNQLVGLVRNFSNQVQTFGAGTAETRCCQ